MVVGSFLLPPLRHSLCLWIWMDPWEDDPGCWFWRGSTRVMVDAKGWYLSMMIDESVPWRCFFFLWSQTEATDSKSLVEEHSKSATVDLINWSLRSPRPYACIKPQAEEGRDLSQSSRMIAISLALSQLFQWQ